MKRLEQEFFARTLDLSTFPAEMRKFYPAGTLERNLEGQKDYRFDYAFLREFAEQPARIVAAGGPVGMGSHGDFPGIGLHWEMWLHSMGGMKNHDVLHAATILERRPGRRTSSPGFSIHDNNGLRVKSAPA